MSLSILYPALLVIPIAVLHFVLKFRDRALAAKALVAPIDDDEKFLRAPGESALKKKRELDGKIIENLFFILTTPAIALVAYLSIPANSRTSPGSWIVWAIALPVYLAYLAITVRDFCRFYKQRENWHLGFRGERAVGEYLNQLMLDGCRVFHDFPLNGDGNLDHVVVAPSGVYAIETKTKSKHSKLKDNHVLNYDGKKLEFPDWTDTAWLTQAHNQANQLARILAAQLKKPIDAEPVLTFPGWYIKRRGQGDVHVLNHKEIAGLILDTKQTLSPDDIEKISAYLDHRCRDVAF